MADRLCLVSLGAAKEFESGKTLIHEGERGTRVFLLLSGVTKVTANTVDGRNILLDVRVGGELVGEMGAFNDGIRAATVTAASYVLTRSLTQAEFLRYLDEHPAAWREVARTFSIKMRLLTQYRLTANVRSVRIRLAQFLLGLADRCGESSPSGERLGLPLTHDEIAEMIGSSQPDVQRAFAYLRNKGAVQTAYRTQVITDRQVLQRIADMADTEPDSVPQRQIPPYGKGGGNGI